ncbi:hypothetical protein Bpfe_009367 [Biomphalaria pfeifferi]|uniref:Uncharacterized protein n=1 Tax=Biomphalaria pfeifferi TaxID=112525 RepID=A0AAD8FF76_BIOPF|nr:hypothetical protein Bpfe_009367 [Biomphalaria pfeifferi]
MTIYNRTEWTSSCPCAMSQRYYVVLVRNICVKELQEARGSRCALKFIDMDSTSNICVEELLEARVHDVL